MHEYPLRNKTIVITGTSVLMKVMSEIEQLGGKAMSCPLIETVEMTEPYDHLKLEMTKNVDWLIFTSQNGVDYFFKKLKRLKKPLNFRCKIAAVGEKTAQRLEMNGLSVHFMPSTYSADVFVQEFPPVAGEKPRCLFIRGKKAKDTVKDGLPFLIQEWNVYDTQEKRESIQQLIDCIQTNGDVVIIFASPSAVDVYAKYIAPSIGWGGSPKTPALKLASIGHITSSALEAHGATVTYQPTTYTMQAVIKDIIKKGEGL